MPRKSVQRGSGRRCASNRQAGHGEIATGRCAALAMTSGRTRRRSPPPSLRGASPRATWQSRRAGNAGGFTLIEIIVIVAIIGIIAALGIPALQNLIHRSRMEGFMREVSILMTRARLESIRRGVQTVVELRDTGGDAEPDRVLAFADVHGAGGVGTAPDLIYNPDAAPPAGTSARETDYQIGALDVSEVLVNEGPAADNEGIEGFTPRGGGGLDIVAIFNTNGSIEDTGAFRFSDEHGNSLEVRVAPRGTARIALRKYNEDLPANEYDGTQWYEFGEGGEAWEWH